MNITIGKPWAVCEKGGRQNNEDSIYPLPERVNSNQKLFLVCDGVGGSEKGEIASSLACESFQTFFSTFLEDEPTEEFVNKAVGYTEVRFDDYVKNHPEAKGMATTLTMVSVGASGITLAHIGDSRIYRHFQGKLRQISTDHVIGGKMLGKAPLTQYLGFQEENMALEPSIVEIGYQTGSSYLICSDGVTDMLSDEEIREILGKNSTAEEKVEELLEMALAKGGRDNVTMVLAQISGYEERNPLKRWAERYSTGR